MDPVEVESGTGNISPARHRPPAANVMTPSYKGKGDAKSLAVALSEALDAEADKTRAVDEGSKLSFRFKSQGVHENNLQSSRFRSFRGIGNASHRSLCDLSALKAFATSPDLNVQDFRAANGLKQVVTVIKTNPTKVAVLERGCLFMAVLARGSKDHETELVTFGAVVVLGDILRKSLNTSPVVVAALLALESLTSEEGNRKEVVNKGGAAATIHVMDHGTITKRIASLGCRVLSNSVFGDENSKVVVGKTGGMRVITKVMEQYSDDAAIQQSGALALRNIGYKCQANHDLAHDQHVISALLTTLTNFLGNKEIVHQSSVALANFTSTNLRNRVVLELNGAIALIFRLFDKLGHSSSSTEDGLVLLRNITAQNESAVRQIELVGGVGPTIEAIKRHRTNAPLVEKGVAALRYICFSDGNRRSFCKGGGVELLSGILRQPLAMQRAEHSILALGNGVFRNHESKMLAATCGAIPSLVALGKRNSSDPVILDAVCRTLHCLVDQCTENFTSALDSGVISLIVDIMAENPDAASTQVQCLAILFVLAEDEKCKEVINATTVENYIRVAILGHAKHRGVQLHSMLLLGRLYGADVHLPLPSKKPLPARGLRTSGKIVSASGHISLENPN